MIETVIKEFIEEENKKHDKNIKVLGVSLTKTFNYGEYPVVCFKIETDDGENPYLLTYLSKEESDIPSAIYNVNMFNLQTLDDMNMDVVDATFRFHIGTMKTGKKNLEILMQEAENATIH